MPKKVPQGSHKGSHIVRRKGIYCYRRRLPGVARGEVCLSLRTRRFREAEHRAAILDDAFDNALSRARLNVSDAVDLNAVLREYLQHCLEADLEWRLMRPAGDPLFGDDGGLQFTATEVDLDTLSYVTSDAREALADRNTRSVAERVQGLMEAHGLPEEVRKKLALGVLEVHVYLLEEIRRRCAGTAPLVFDPNPPPAPPSVAAAVEAPQQAAPQKPLASSLVEPFFVRRESVDLTTHQVMGQDRGTLRRFLEVCGDKPVEDYQRGDVTSFLDTLRRLPSAYGKSPKDKDRTVAEIIAEADAANAQRLKDKTIKRHLSALSQFLQFAVDRSLLTVSAHAELTDGHRFRADGSAREQRDAWTSEELGQLFRSPVWTGSHPFFRSRPGAEVFRDAKFWLPILALYHGARLEEFADLYRRDVGLDGGVWYVRITNEERRLKNENANRVVPLHPEVIRLGFLEHIARTAPNPDDPLFPDIEPQGKDRKRGPHFTRFFENYRKQIGLYRKGVATHAFRHNASTRLRDVIQGYQQVRHTNSICGHSSGGGEGDERYDKGPGLAAKAETLALLRYPEIDLSRHYVREAGDTRSPWNEGEAEAR